MIPVMRVCRWFKLFAKAVLLNPPVVRPFRRFAAGGALPLAVCYCQSTEEEHGRLQTTTSVNHAIRRLESYCGWSLDAVSSMVTQAYLELVNAHRMYRDSLKEAIAWMNANDLLPAVDGGESLAETVSDRVIESRLSVEQGRKAVRDAELLVEFAKKALQAVGETAFLAEAEGIGIMAGERLLSYEKKEEDEKMATSELEDDYVRAHQQHILATAPESELVQAKPAEVSVEHPPIDPSAVHYDETYFSLADLFFL